MGNEEETLDKTKLIAKRGQVKALLTRIKTFVDGYDPSQSVSLLSGRLLKVEECWKTFDTIQAKIEDLVDDEESSGERELFEDQFFSLKSRIEDLILLPKTSSSVSPTSSAICTPTPFSEISVKLPTIDLPIFNGTYQDWLQFHDTFQSLIDDNQAINKIQKFHYLKSSLRGEALKVIQSLSISSANYDIAWDLLKNRFENKKLTKNKHIQSLFNLQKVEREVGTSLRQLLDNMQIHMQALKALGEPTDHWDTLIVYLVTTKLDSATRRTWETNSSTLSAVKYTDLVQFLEQRCKILEACDDGRTSQLPKQSVKDNKFKPFSSSQTRPPSTSCLTSNSKSTNCIICKQEHAIHQCEEFQKLSISERIKKAKDMRLCLNCLRFGHQTIQCKNPGSCRKCRKRHHTLLHQDDALPTNSASDASGADLQSMPTVATCSRSNSEIILATAQVLIADSQGALFSCRVLLDSGSQSHFITESMAQALGLKRYKSRIPILGINQKMATANHTVHTTIKSQFNAYKAELEFLVINKITGDLPLYEMDLTDWNFPEGIKLADPHFNVPRGIDALLGAEIFFELMCIGQVQMGKNLPLIQKTSLGWIVTGRVSESTQSSRPPHVVCHLSQQTNLEDLLSAFWRIEECTSAPKMSKQEEACEAHYVLHVQRTPNGRFVVHLPFHQDPKLLGDSKNHAINRFKGLERRFTTNITLKTQYCDFLNEYLELGHMELVEEDEKSKDCYYLLHHPILKTSSSTTKLRVVFDASAKTSNGLSLNNILLVGPTIQRDLFSIILSFRMHAYVFTTDIKQMYRQVLIDSSQIDYQRILWLNNTREELRTYRLTTVTYGTAAAPFLAIRSLRQLAEEEKNKYPLAALVTENDFYVDDVLTGSDSLETALQIQSELIEMLHQGGFELRKWCANNSAFLKNILPEHIDEYYAIENEGDSATIKALGVYWQPNSDTFQYKVLLPDKPEKVTKRTILSDTCRLFDPLGLVGPVIVKAKLLMQQLWQLNINWDESVPSHLHTAWMQYRSQLIDLNYLAIKRRVTHGSNITSTELHGFSDASEASYGACLYLRCEQSNGEISVNLLCAKSRVAPLKKISLPRLELCGALILAQLVQKSADALIRHRISSIHLWTDSTIVLHWLASPSNTWKTFVANRVSEIHSLTSQCTWNHVSSIDNPADILSRGASPKQLIDSTLWWFGPTWLRQDSLQWPTTFINHAEQSPPDILEEKKHLVISCPVSQNLPSSLNLDSKFSCWYKLLRITALCRRFFHNARLRHEQRQFKPLTILEIQEAECYWIKIAQQQYFADEFKQLKNENQVKPKSRLRTLNPFIDSKDLIRVGGRLKNSEVDYNHKHPILLPAEHRITILIMEREHQLSLHCGPQALLAKIRTKFWPINGKTLARRIVRKCIKCFKTNPGTSTQMMGDLPQYRVQPSRPFINCGVDYCGPILVRRIQQRRSAPIKTYIALFICMSTKAIHLELVTDLTTEAFLAALKRFMSRRGKCSNIYCDNASTFVGAKNELHELKKLFLTEAHQQKVAQALAEDQTTFHFIPARSPHFGGLWEAGVKTVKNHLKRVVGDALLTFDQLNTLLCQIEACVNSRPITCLSSHPNDLNPLTPGHFLIGSPLTSPVEPDLTPLSTNRLSQWQRVQQLLQNFWSRWSAEYLSSLQQRYKWTNKNQDLPLDSLVLLKEDFRPPLKWETGRVVQLHPGADGAIRVATVKTSTGLFKRAIAKLCPLPLE